MLMIVRSRFYTATWGAGASSGGGGPGAGASPSQLFNFFAEGSVVSCSWEIESPDSIGLLVDDDKLFRSVAVLSFSLEFWNTKLKNQ